MDIAPEAPEEFTLIPATSSGIRLLRPALVLLVLILQAHAQPAWDLLIRGWHVIDPKNKIDQVLDVALKDGKIARVAVSIPASDAKQIIEAGGLYVTPGLIDIHTHVFAGGETIGSAFAGGSFGIAPDGMSFRNGVTTIADAGSSGWRSFPEFKRRIIDRDTNYPKVRVFAFLNIVGHGMGGGQTEQRTSDMDGEATAKVARQYPELVVGIKVAHYTGRDWTPVEQAVKRGMLANIPVMVDFGRSTPEHAYQDLVLKHLRPGDISTHMYASSIPLFDGKRRLLPYLAEARKRGIIFDLGHGNKSFFWDQAIEASKQGWLPDSVSTDIHVRSQLTSMKDMTTSMSRVLLLGASFKGWLCQPEHLHSGARAPDAGSRLPELPSTFGSHPAAGEGQVRLPGW